jgi:hypothetical protein
MVANTVCISSQPIALTAATVAGIWGERTSSTVAGRPKPSLKRSSIAATLARTSGTGASIRERSPHAAHSTVSQTGFTAEPAASSSEVFSCSTFSAAATASDGLTLAGSARATVPEVGVASRSTAGSVTTRKTGSSVA